MFLRPSKLTMKPITKLTTFLGAIFIASSAAAATPASGGVPLHFSLTVQPVKSNRLALSPVSTLSGLDDSNVVTTSGGFKVDTALTAGNLSGGVTFLQGDALQGDSFSNWYETSPKAGLGLQPVFILPSEYLDSYTALNVSSSSHINSEGIALHGGYELSPNLRINGAFLVAKSTKLTKVDELQSTSEKTNWQLNLGGAYKFKGNLVYSVNFGYQDGGNIFQKNNADLAQGHAYVVKHQLNMSF